MPAFIGTRAALLSGGVVIPPDLALFAKYGASGFLHYGQRIDTTFQDTSGATPADDVGEAAARWNDISGKGNNALQSASTSFRPVRQAGGCIRFDGTDDNLLSTLTPGAAMTLAVRMKATAADRMVLGARQVTNGRGFIYVHSTGLIAGGVGAQGAATIQGGSSILNTTGVAVLTWDGSTVNLYWNGVLLYTGAQSGTPDTTVPFRLGALNDNGTASTFYAGDIFQALAIQVAITPAEAASLNYWNTL